MGIMSQQEVENLKSRIRSELNANLVSQRANRTNQNNISYQNNRVNTLTNTNQRINVPPTMNPNEFHGKNMVHGSTGVYNDMEGGAHFDKYDCGHEYNDNVIRPEQHQEEKPAEKHNYNYSSQSTSPLSKAEHIRSLFKDTQTIQDAVIISEVLNRKYSRRRKRYNA